MRRKGSLGSKAMALMLSLQLLALPALGGSGDLVFEGRAGQQVVQVREVATGLDTPWSLAFLPEGRMLVSERPGRLRVIDAQGQVSAPLAGVPEVHARGQGGLLDVVLSPDFERDQLIFFAYAEPTQGGARTAVARARLDLQGLRLTELTQVFAQNEDPSGRHHWGARLVFDREGRLFIALGDRFSHRDQAQALDSHLGKVVRVQADGSVPADNPFVGRDKAAHEVWSFGHRNIQGAALHPHTGVLWTHEHGPQGGDEVNVGQPGGNYGWPVVTQGREYVTGARIGEATERADVVPAAHVWIPSIAPSGMAFYDADRFPDWRGSLFVGALRGAMLVRLTLDGDAVVAEERLLGEMGARIRDVRQGPDGLLYLLDESAGRVLRVQPAD